MVLAVLLAVVGCGLAVVGLVTAAGAWQRSTLLRDRRRRRIVLTLKTEAAFSGVLYATDREALVLREAEALAYGARKTNIAVEGELVVLRADVAYLQVLP